MSAKKRLPATKQRLKQAMKRGDFPKSKEITAFFILTSGILWVYFVILSNAMLQNYYIKTLGEMADFSVESMLVSSLTAVGVLVKILCPFLIVVFLLSALGELVQVRFKLYFNPIGFKLERLNFVDNFKNIFCASKSSPPTKLFYELIRKALILFASVGLLGCLLVLFVLKFVQGNIIEVSELGLHLKQSFGIFSFVTLSLFLLYALIDYAVCLKRWKAKHQMDFEDYKKEFRENEGSPEIKGMRFQLHQEILRKSLVEGVRKARVVIDNRC